MMTEQLQQEDPVRLFTSYIRAERMIQLEARSLNFVYFHDALEKQRYHTITITAYLMYLFLVPHLQPS